MNVTDPPEGSVVMLLITLLLATLTGPQTAPPLADPQAPVTLASPLGTASENAVPLAASGPLLVTTTVYDSVVPHSIVAGPDLVTATLATGVTVKLALAAAALLPALVVRAPAGMVLA